MSRQFTGRHMWMVMIGFFGLIFVVNFTMAWFATSTFGGTVVDNSYVASQSFNGWLREARAQKQLGWNADLGVSDDRRVRLSIASSSGAQGFAATGTAHHPVGQAPDVKLVFVAGEDGVLLSDAALPPGRWLARIAVQRDGHTMKLAQTLQ